MFVGERPFPFKALPKVTPLLAYLLLHQDTPTDRDVLAFKLWPDGMEKQARTRLRRHLYDLRRALPASLEDQEWLLITSQTVQWNPAAPTWLDVAAFEHLSQQPHRLAEAIALYTGDLLPDIDETWLFLAREQWQRRYLQTLGKLIEQNWQQQDYRQALIYSQQALTEDALNEEMMRQQLALHYALGDRATAVQLFNDFTTRLRTQLDVEPMAETTAVYTAIQQEQATDHIAALAGFTNPSRSNPQSFDKLRTGTPTSQPAIPHNLSLPLRPLIGRQQELQELSDLLTAVNPARLITLIGTAGIGKTRLAMALAHHLRQEQASLFPDGIFLVSLAPINEAARLPETIAMVLSTKPKPKQTYLDALVEQLRYKQLLLVLDNFEHVMEAALTVAALLKTLPGLHVIVTSQVALDLYGEQEYPVLPLQLPDKQAPLAVLQEAEAIALFVMAVKATQPRFKLTAENATAVSEICIRLDGLPLAIELAAARCKHYPPAQLLSQLQDNMALLTNRYRDVSTRHQTLAAAIQWSFDLLDDEAKALFVRLSLFADGFSPTAVSHILFIADYPVTEMLIALAERNLIYTTAEAQADGEQRFAMLHTIRLFALQKWAELEDKASLQTRYLNYYATVLQPVSSQWHSNKQADWNRWISVEEENIRQALAWSIGDPHLPGQTEAGILIATSLATGYWEAKAQLKEAVRIIQLADNYADDVSAETAVRFLRAAGTIADVAGLDDEVAYRYRDKALQRAYQTENQELIILCLDAYGSCANRRGDFARAEEFLTKALALAEKENSDAMFFRRASIMMNLAISIKSTQNDLEQALTLQERSLAIVRSLERPSDIAKSLLSLANTYRHLGYTQQHAACLREGLQIGREIDNKFAQILLLIGTINHAHLQERIGQAIQLLSAVMTISQKMDIQWTPHIKRKFDDELSEFRPKVSAEKFTASWSKGAAMSLDQAVTFALDTVLNSPE